jgi:linoleoyl-CoA desaturase
MNSSYSTQFVMTLNDRINAYFKEKDISVKSDAYMVSKIVTGTAWWLLSYFAMYLWASTPSEFILLYLFHGVGHIFFAFNVGHDALHNAISKNNAVNRFWAYSYDLIGVNTYMWRFMHHQGHHACLNVHGEDMSLETAGIMRLAHNEEWKKKHRYQHIYAFAIYGLFLLYYVFVKDYKYFFSKNNVHLKNVKHPTMEWVKLFAGKAFYLGYMLFIPIWLLPFDWYIVVLAYVLTSFMIGFVLSFTFQTTHIIDTTHYPDTKIDYDNYVYHVFETTADYATTNPVANWFFGGLNVHVIHHLRSDICHTHYPALTRIVKNTAAEFGVPYRENFTILSSIQAHLRQLKKLGKLSAPIDN